jgi:hypothetical protein
MPIDVQYPVYLCGENPGLTLFKPDTDQPVAVASYWHVTYSPHGVGNALVLWLDASASPLASGGIFTDNISLARILVDTLTQHFPEFSDVPVAALPYHEAHCGHTFDGSRYVATCQSGGNRISIEWADLLDRKFLSWTQFPTGEQNFDLHNIVCPCNSGRILVNDEPVKGSIKTRTLSDGHPSSTAFLAFAESWVGPLEAGH